MKDFWLYTEHRDDLSSSFACRARNKMHGFIKDPDALSKALEALAYRERVVHSLVLALGRINEQINLPFSVNGTYVYGGGQKEKQSTMLNV
ncbi:MAG: hypothetical protein LUP95_03230 [Euryarchaeota archaeon]|nr:hypothetical protein [Euryarchaeota archaeon]